VGAPAAAQSGSSSTTQTLWIGLMLGVFCPELYGAGMQRSRFGCGPAWLCLSNHGLHCFGWIRHGLAMQRANRLKALAPSHSLSRMLSALPCAPASGLCRPPAAIRGPWRWPLLWRPWLIVCGRRWVGQPNSLQLIATRTTNEGAVCRMIANGAWRRINASGARAPVFLEKELRSG